MQSKVSRTTRIDGEESGRGQGHRNVWLPQACDRVRAMEKLRAGWDSHGAEPPNSKVIDAAIALLTKLADAASFAKPHIQPTPVGGIQFEWESAGRYLEVECTPSSEAHCYYQDREAGVEEEQVLPSGGNVDVLLKYLVQIA